MFLIRGINLDVLKVLLNETRAAGATGALELSMFVGVGVGVACGFLTRRTSLDGTFVEVTLLN